MIRSRKKDSPASVTQSVLLGRRPTKYAVKDVVKSVRFSFLAAIAKIDMVEEKVA
jgi:hypothetical protein